MSVLSELKPEKVFYYFEEICRIPHGSFHTKEISDYCVTFAKERKLEVIQDEVGNVVIRKQAAEGYEDSDPIILQGHLDMVCEKTPDSVHDFKKDGLELILQDGFLSAKDTTLGGDDGIAVAMMLAILDSEDISHPALEAVFTTDEEVGMGGAQALDLEQLTGRMLINIDSEEEGFLTVGCAGGYRFDAGIPIEYAETDGCVLQIAIRGLTGGHSGMEIHKQRGNAHVLMGRLLNHLRKNFALCLVDIAGGSKDNVIAMENTARIAVSSEDKVACIDRIKAMEQKWKAEFAQDEPDLTVEVTEDAAGQAFTEDSTERVIAYLAAMPDGVISFERQIEGQVETSLNAGIVKTKENCVVISHLVRSSVESKKEMLKERLQTMVQLAGGKGTVRDEYPAWSYRKDSRLRDIMTAVYQETYGKKPEVITIHAGLECGLFVGKKPELDCVSFGPDLLDVHSVKERMNIASVERSYNYLLEVLKAAR
ncbi:MAG: aminoacyl-histidine dipeptidase [Eubacteriales bacterium]|nr:aminoacyl-histidine dipeptidase [Eubacteriales bacterium]